jgi:hypothetical protein
MEFGTKVMPLKVTSMPEVLSHSFKHSQWQTLKLLMRAQNFHQSMWDHDILYAHKPSEDE